LACGPVVCRYQDDHNADGKGDACDDAYRLRTTATKDVVAATTATAATVATAAPTQPATEPTKPAAVTTTVMQKVSTIAPTLQGK